MNIIVVGGGAAGMMAAVFAARNGATVTLLEKNEKLGKKVYITGKGRCNITNDCYDEDFFKNVITNPKFMYSSYYGFTSAEVIEFFEDLGCKVKTERGNRVFPVSDHSSDVIGALKRELNRLNVNVRLGEKVDSVNLDENNSFSYVLLDSKEKIYADKLILATGGKSYPVCGADGDTWKFANELSIKTNAAEPALVPLVPKENIYKDLQGLSLKNVEVKLFNNKNKKIYSGFGEMLFTHFGLSGPLILSASSYIKEADYENNLRLVIDLKPALTEEVLDERLLRDFSENQNKAFANVLGGLLPSKLIPVIVELSNIDSYKKINLVTKEERKKLVKLLKNLEFTIIGNRGFNEAIITRGGINVKEINPTNMESKNIKNLYFAGEMIDVDALTGGFNLQIAWSTGKLAGESAATE